MGMAIALVWVAVGLGTSRTHLAVQRRRGKARLLLLLGGRAADERHQQQDGHGDRVYGTGDIRRHIVDRLGVFWVRLVWVSLWRHSRKERRLIIFGEILFETSKKHSIKI